MFLSKLTGARDARCHDAPNNPAASALNKSASGSLLSRLWRDRKGNIGMTFGLLVIPVLAVVGGAVDLGNAHSARTKMQKALDGATLAAARKFGDTGDVAAAVAAAQAHYNALPRNVATGTITPVSVASGRVEFKASGAVKAPFLQFAGISSLPISAKSIAESTGKDLEVGLVLDVTGSMGGSKLSNLKIAAKDFLSIVMTAQNRRVGLVPFAHAINVGNYFETATGVPAYNPGGNYPDSCYKKKKNGNYKYDKNGNKKVKNKCKNDPQYQGWNYSKCVVERTYGFGTTDDAPGTGKYFGIHDLKAYRGSCRPSSAEIVPLTTNRSLLETNIDSMVASGYTAGHLGTAWGWYLVSPRWSSIWPTESVPAAYNEPNTMKVVVIMTDGEYNTYYESSNGTSQTQAGGLCTAMKQEGVIVYTIGFGNLNNSQKQLLRDCATSNDHYFFPYDGAALRQVFRDIGERVASGADGTRITN